MPDRESLTKYFSERLVRLLIQNGYTSRSASTGVKVKELANNLGCSFEMARRYTNGDALPDALAIKTIAEWLKVDPGWLLYGTEQERDINAYYPILLTKADMKLLLERIIPAYSALNITSELLLTQLHSFFCDVISDFSKLYAPHEIKLKILEASLASALHFLPHSDKTILASPPQTKGTLNDLR
ncbi:MAG: helix-turn-helix domain-containing protein [Gammaproteobacteria bacterium]